jgi:hypothetical protein
LSYRWWRAALAGALAGLACAASAAGAQTVPTNFELVREAAREAAAELAADLQPLQLEGALSLRLVGTHPGGFLVENALSSALADAGRTVRAKADSTGPVLEFEVVDLGLSYTDVHRRAWLGEKRVDREARARLFARLVDQAQGSILWADQAEAKKHDEVRHADLPALEEKSGAEYLKAAMPERRWNKLVEPAVVTGIVVGLIVLFFSNQETAN